MALVLKDRVKETSVTTGTGTMDLDGAVTNFETFVSAIGDTNTTYYCIAHTGSYDEWEVGLGTVASGSPNQLARTTVIINSLGSTAKIDFTAGTMDVFCTEPASKTMEMLMTAQSDIIYASAANTPARLAKGAANEVLAMNSGATAPEWVVATTGDITSVVAGTGLSGGATSGAATLNIANTGVSATSYTNTDLTVNAQGQITTASSGSSGITAGFSIAMSIAL